MDFKKLCETRYSVRSFSSSPVEEEKKAALVEMVRLAPTAKNAQPYELYAFSGAGLEKVKQAAPTVFNAPLVFAVCKDENKKWNNFYSGEEFTLQDIGIIATTLVYGAFELGLGSIYICRFDPDKLAEVCAMPESVKPKCLVAVGYAADDAKPSDKHYERRVAGEFFHEIF